MSFQFLLSAAPHPCRWDPDAPLLRNVNLETILGGDSDYLHVVLHPADYIQLLCSRAIAVPVGPVDQQALIPDASEHSPS